MKKLLLSALVLLSSLIQLFAATQRMNLSSDPKVVFPQWNQTGKAIIENDKPALRFTWDSEKGETDGPRGRAEYIFADKDQLVFKEYKTLTISLKCRLHPGTSISHINLRFVDVQGETFQVMLFEKFSNVATLTTVLKSDAPAPPSWGKNKNSKFDFPIKLAAIAVSYENHCGIGTLDILDLAVDVVKEGDKPPVKLPVEMNLNTFHAARVIDPADNGYIDSTLHNLSNSTINFTADITVTDVDNNELGHLSRTCKIDNGRYSFFKMPAVPKKYGVYYVTAVLTPLSGNYAPITIRKSFAVAKLTGYQYPYKKGDFRFGVQMHWWPMNFEDMKDKADIVTQAGIRFIRPQIKIGNFMTGPDSYDFSYIDAHVDYMLAHGIQIESVMGSTSHPWAHSVKMKPGEKRPESYLPRYDVWENYCKALFTRYNGKIHGVELWNEPDLETFCKFSPQELMELGRIAKKAKDLYGPDMELLSPGYCGFNGARDSMHERTMEWGKDKFDAHCIHGHGSYHLYRETLERNFFTMRKQYGLENVPWYPHETGLTVTDYGEKAQAEALWKKLIYSWAKGAIGYTWFDLRNAGYDPRNTEHNYGMVTHDLYPKPAYVTYNALIGIFNGPTHFVKEINDGTNADMFLFEKEGNLMLTMWCQNQRTAGTRIFYTDAAEATLVDMYGNTEPAVIRDHKVIVPANLMPVTLIMKKAKVCQLFDMPMTSEAMALLFTDNKATAEISIKNTDKSPLRLSLGVICPTGIASTFKGEEITVPAGKTVIRKVPFTADPKKTKVGSEVIFTGKTESMGTLELSMPIRLVKTLPREFVKNEPMFVLDSRDQTIEFFDANPGERHRLRTGNKDNSSRIYMAGDSKAFKLRVEVEDDIHSQCNKGDYIWKGDSIQVYLTFPSSTTFWQFGCALLDDGKVEQRMWGGDWNSRFTQKLSCNVTRKGTQTVYELSFPWEACGISEKQILGEGFSLSLLVNDSDSNVLESRMQVTPGVGDHIDATQYPAFKVTK